MTSQASSPGPLFCSLNPSRARHFFQLSDISTTATVEMRLLLVHLCTTVVLPSNRVGTLPILFFLTTSLNASFRVSIMPTFEELGRTNPTNNILTDEAHKELYPSTLSAPNPFPKFDFPLSKLSCNTRMRLPLGLVLLWLVLLHALRTPMLPLLPPLLTSLLYQGRRTTRC